MIQLSIDELFNIDKKSQYQSIEDEALIQEKILTLTEVYEFSLNSRSDKYCLFTHYDDEEEAIIFKLNNEYYLTSIDGCDGYRDDRGQIYKIIFDEKKLILFLEEQKIFNSLTCPIDVVVQADSEIDAEGIVFFINNYNQSEDNYLLRLSTQNANDYYPGGLIHFNQNLLLKATPIIEKHNLDKQIEAQSGTTKKIKL